MLKIAFHQEYIYQLPASHRFPMIKYELLPEQLLHEGTISESQFFNPGKLTGLEILQTHSNRYLKNLNSLSLDAKEIRKIGFPLSKSLVERGKIISNGTYKCALFALEHKISMNIAGGTHHSFTDRGEGFCLFNDIAIASNLLLNQNLVQKILIVDLDVHQGNGTAKIFENEEKVFTFSMHGEKNYPTKKEKSDLDVGLPDHTTDAHYLKTLTESLPYLIDTVQPDIIFYLSGVDILESDKLGRLAVSKQGCKLRDKYVLSLAKQNSIPIVCCMGGGYSPDIKIIIEAHANTFREAMDLFY